jgi:hypothetical protein
LFANETGDAERLDDIPEYLTCVPLGDPMVDIYQTYPTIGILELMILTIGGDIDIRPLANRFFNEFGSRTAAKCNSLYLVMRGTRITNVCTI